MKNLHRALIAAFISLLIAGCSGGKSSTAIPTANGNQSVAPAAKTQATSLTMQIPQSIATQSKKSRLPQYVSASTLGVAVWVVVPPATITVTPTAVADFSATSPACVAGSNGARTCTITIPAPIGSNDTFVVSTYDQVPANGMPQGNLLSSNNITAVSIVAGQVNTVPVTLNGIPATIVINPPAVAVPAGQPSSFAINVNAKDVDGNYIIGTGSYATPINLAITGDPNTTLSLSSSSVAAPSGSTITVNFNGGSLGTGTITATASGATSSHTTVTASNAVSQVTFTIPGFSSQAVYIASGNTGLLSRFASNATGASTPTFQIKGSVPLGLAADNANEYVVESNLSIDVFPIGATSGPPTAVISGSNTNLCSPVDIAVYSGTLYVADACAGVLEWSTGASGNVAPARQITGAGTGLTYPSTIAVNATGIYVANRRANGTVVVEPLNANGNQTPSLVIPSGANSFDATYGPQGIAVDAAGNVYVSSNGPTNSTVAVFAPGTTTASYAITGNNAFCAPQGLALDGLGNIWVANDCDTQSNPERYKVNAFAVGAVNANNGPVASFGGLPNTDFSVEGCCAMIAVDASNNIYAANQLGANITSFNQSGTLLTTLTIAPFGTLAHPEGIAFDGSGNVYIADSGLSTVSEYLAGQTTPNRVFWPKISGVCDLWSVALDTAGHIFVSSDCTSSIYELPANAANATVPLATLTGPGSGLSGTDQIAFDYAGNLYAANAGNNSITIYANGLIGNGTPTSTIVGGNTQLSAPSGVAIDPAGYVYVLNNFPGSVTVYAPGSTGNVAPVRTISNVGSGNGMLAVDQFQNVYVNNGGFQVWAATANGAVPANVTVSIAGSASSPSGIAISPTQP